LVGDFGECFGGGGLEEFAVGEEVEQLSGDGGFEVIRRDPLAGAGAGAFGLAGAADVVAVEAVASVRPAPTYAPPQARQRSLPLRRYSDSVGAVVVDSAARCSRMAWTRA
jgi:hypothetical protein